LIIDLFIDIFINCMRFSAPNGKIVVNDEVKIEQRSGPTYCGEMTADS
jgi:hypothetical protein